MGTQTDRIVPLHVGRAADLEGRDRWLYRALEMLPGFLSWGTLIGVVLLSIYAPVIAAYFIIAFSFYWLLKTVYLSLHLRHNWRRLQYNMKVDWNERLSHLKHEHLWHLVILPFYKEPRETIQASLDALVGADGDKSKLIVVLAAEERAGAAAADMAHELADEYRDHFGHLAVTVHPKDVPGEMPGKGSNIAYAAEAVRTSILDANNIPYADVIVSAFDIDTVVYPQYFTCLSWNFLTTDDPYHASFQPVPLYNNNIWDAPMLARVVSVSSTFWQMIQQERPEKQATFSSHAVSFKALHDGGYWQRNMVNEDSRIFWNLFFANDGNYRVVSLAYPVSMDANFSPSLFKTLGNIYRQHRRWTYGVENVPYIIYQSIKRRAVPLGKRIRASLVQVEGFWSLATHPLILFLLGWLPLLLGSREFHVTVLSYNLPTVARSVLTLAMFGLVVSAIISLSLLPPRPAHRGRHTFVFLVVQWLLIPATMIIFSAIPGLEAQTRLLFGRYLGFWVTPKSAGIRRESSDGAVSPLPVASRAR